MDFSFDPSLVLYLPLYELDGASFMSKDAYGHLSTVNGASWRPTGRYFDGLDDYITIPHNTILDITTGDFTLIVMAKVAAGLNGDVIAGKMKNAGDIGNGGYSIYVRNTDPYIKFFLTDKTNSVGTTNFPSDIRGDGSFHSLAGVFKSAADQILTYLDGVEADDTTSGAVIGSLTNTTDAFDIGRASNGGVGGSYFTGSVSEIWLYHRALTPLEIQHNYLATKWRYR